LQIFADAILCRASGIFKSRPGFLDDIGFVLVKNSVAIFFGGKKEKK